MKRTLICGFLGFVASMLVATQPVEAASYIEARVAMGAISKTWVDGDKRREEIVSDTSGQGVAALLQLAGPMGNQIKITRPDRGVEWTLYPALKSYSERRLELPYPPVGDPKGEEDDSLKLENLPGAKDVKIQFEKLPGTKTVAGFPCQGYATKASSGGLSQGDMRTWVAPIKSPLDAVLKDQENFEKKLRAAEYAKWPEAERAQRQKDLESFARILSKGLGMGQPLAGIESVPEGFPMLIEMAGGGEEGHSFLTGPLFEVIAVKTDVKPADGFDLPSGWKKTSEEAVARAAGAQMMQKLFKQGAPGNDEGEGGGDENSGQVIPQNLQQMLQHLQGGGEDPQ
jgi:hypothetical protein